VEVATGRRGRRRPAGWTVVALLVAVVVAAPLLTVPASLLDGDALGGTAGRLLPEALRASVVLGLGVGLGALLLGGSLAALVSFYDFPGRGWLEWMLVLPLAMPAYVLVFVLLGQYDADGTLQTALRAVFGDGVVLPDVRSTWGAIAVLTLVLYPYVFVLGRAAFLEQSRDTFEAARVLGLKHHQAVVRLALRSARPGLAAGVALAVMEALADFGAVNLLNYRALTDSIYRLWYGAFDRNGALQLATVLLGLALGLLLVERLLRGRARYLGALTRGEAVVPRRLHGARAALALALPALLLTVVLALPVLQLVAWAAGSLDRPGLAGRLAGDASTSLLLGAAAAVLASLLATLIAYGRRVAPSRAGSLLARVTTLGYALPGSVVAVAVYAPLAWMDRRFIAVGRDVFGVELGLLLTGTVLGLLFAYLVRFHALALFAIGARLERLDPAYDDAARSLGADRTRVLAEVHAPLLWPGIATAALLVFVEVVKELPATALLRPLGGDTLAIAVWEATKDSRFDTAALPALLIVLVGLVPTILLARIARAGTRLERGMADSGPHT
jgi:iron(III) transport system permease protein